MEKAISRRDFIIQATTATAVACTHTPLIAYPELQPPAKILKSTLSPATVNRLTNVARNRAAYQSSSIDDDHTAHLVTDGSSLTYWECKPDGEQWVSVDLGKRLPINRLMLRWGKSHAQTYRIEVSNEDTDPTQWTPVYATTEGSGKVEEISLPTIHARYIRLVGSTDADQGFSISELEAWSAAQPSSVPSSVPSITKGKVLLKDGWSLQSAMFTASKPEDISSPRYLGRDWLSAIVPGTVLTSYLANGAIPDPFFGDQQSQISDVFFTDNDFWYRNIFKISSVCRGQRLWLVFEGVNWKADVYLNGTRLGHIAGAFVRTRFDITEVAHVGGENCVAVLVHRVAHPGQVQHKQLGEQYRNGGILGLDSPTFVSSIGWNWLPTIRGRNTGIWNNVSFETTGDGILQDPWVATDALSADYRRADLSIRAELTNSSDKPKVCTVTFSLCKIVCKKTWTLLPHESRPIKIDKADCTALAIDNPQLWWPNGYGDPTLHTITMQVECDGTLSDEKTFQFGIRKIDYLVENNILFLYINGHRILCRGGNWGMDNGMLACDEDGYDLRVRMHRDMHLVMIRNWVGMVGKDAFYDACDRYGILIWDDFWLANPGDGPDPSDSAMFLNNARDKVRRIRRHPSVALYCGRNEGLPPADLDAGMQDAVAMLDGTRYYISNSAAGVVTGHGPYENQDPTWYFEHRGATFHSEQGIVCVPPVESLRAMMPEKSLWPIQNMWAIHDYQNPRSVQYTERIAQRYGTPVDIEDYCRKAQMVNLESSKAIYECLQSHQGSGQLIWMTQAAWPALICQLYDYYFEQTSAYFGAKTACEPVHILWDSFSNAIKVANNTVTVRPQLLAQAWIYDLNGREQWHKNIQLELPPTSVHECFPLELPVLQDQVFFLKLKLSSGEKLLSENFYWSAAPAGSLKNLNTLPSVHLEISAQNTRVANQHTTIVHVSNPTPSVALAIRLKLVRAVSRDRILPAMYEDNYFSLLPNEKKIVSVSYTRAALAGEAPLLVAEGWNIEHAEIRIP